MDLISTGQGCGQPRECLKWLVRVSKTICVQDDEEEEGTLEEVGLSFFELRLLDAPLLSGQFDSKQAQAPLECLPLL